MSNKNVPIPLSADKTFADFISDAAACAGMSRSAFIRHASKEYTLNKYPSVHHKYYPASSPPIGAATTQAVVEPIPPATQPVHVSPLPYVLPRTETEKLPIMDSVDDTEDFLAQVKPSNKEVEITYGAPSKCPECNSDRYEMNQGVISRTIIQCSTNPAKGKWLCSECSAHGEYFPDKPPIVL